MLKINRLYHKYSFWAKYILAFTIIILTLLGIYDDKLFYIKTWFLTFLMLILLLLLGSGSTLAQLRIAFCLGCIPKRELEDNLLSLARRMGSNLTKYTPVINYDSALVIGESLVIGGKMREWLSSEEFESVIAHELSHVLRRKQQDRIFNIWITIYAILLVPVAVRFGTNVIPFGLALLYCSAPVFWYRELDSDTNAAAYTDKTNLINALSIIYEGQLDAFSFKHPSVNYRIKNLQKQVSQSETS